MNSWSGRLARLATPELGTGVQNSATIRCVAHKQSRNCSEGGEEEGGKSQTVRKLLQVASELLNNGIPVDGSSDAHRSARKTFPTVRAGDLLSASVVKSS